MEWIKKLNESIGYIEQNLKNEIEYDQILKICACSLPKFQQMFSMICGVPVSEYIRNRRMTIASYELINTSIKIIDLAMQLGYDSPESFTRAYQAFHGVSPSVTRKTKAYEEYHRASIQVQVYGGKFKMGTETIMHIETERIVIRKFKPSDWKDLQEIAVSKENSPFAACDHAWPTDESTIKSVCEYFANDNSIWAVEARDLQKVVCFINFNSMDGQQTLDIGHIANGEYLNQEYDFEALKALYNYGFLQLGAESIVAHWALHDNDKLAPLLKLGMKITETNLNDKFRPEPDGTTGKFEGCKLVVTREEWITNPRV